MEAAGLGAMTEAPLALILAAVSAAVAAVTSMVIAALAKWTRAYRHMHQGDLPMLRKSQQSRVSERQLSRSGRTIVWIRDAVEASRQAVPVDPKVVPGLGRVS